LFTARIFRDGKCRGGGSGSQYYTIWKALHFQSDVLVRRSASVFAFLYTAICIFICALNMCGKGSKKPYTPEYIYCISEHCNTAAKKRMLPCTTENH
jgi:hypothetical protein